MGGSSELGEGREACLGLSIGCEGRGCGSGVPTDCVFASLCPIGMLSVVGEGGISDTKGAETVEFRARSSWSLA